MTVQLADLQSEGFDFVAQGERVRLQRGGGREAQALEEVVPVEGV